MGFGLGDLGSGILVLGFGLWALGSWCWGFVTLGSGLWALGLVIRLSASVSVPLVLGIRLSALVIRRSVLGIRSSALRSRLLSLGSELWLGHWALSLRIWSLGFWAMGLWLACFRCTPSCGIKLQIQNYI